VNCNESFAHGRFGGSGRGFVPFQKADVEQSISKRFEQIGGLHPYRPAVVGHGKVLTYDDLSQLANKIAWSLLDICSNPQSRIALLLEEKDLIGAQLGILKAGHIYVPLDPSAPTIRNQFILRDTEATLILTNHQHFTLAGELARGNVRLMNISELDSDKGVQNPGLAIDPDAIAYIIYTSGSTGQPKGVVETHRNLLHNVMRNTNTLQISQEDRVSLLRSVGAAGAARDALSALLNGAALCPFSVKENGLQALAAWLMEYEITIFTTVITVFRHLGAVLSGLERFPALRLIYVGGEQVTKRDVDLYKKFFSDDCVFVNRLGITETGTVTYFFIDRNTPFTGAVIPVGYPPEDTEILILDEKGDEILDDSIGEIAIKSEFLSSGYWRRPDLTRSVFLPDPAGGNKRIYRSGDVGRKLKDGCLIHLGWKDFHLNIRGHRIEAAEVEFHLLEHPDISEAVVVGREHPSGEIHLAAAVVPVQQCALNLEALRDFLKGRLPDYMIPSAFIVLDALPVGPNGKIDRRSLPPPQWLPLKNENITARPRTELEELILGVWTATLGIELVGIRDNFFELGGHSLLLGQVASRLYALFGVEISMDQFLKTPTVEVLAQVVQRALKTDQADNIPLARVSRVENIRLSFAQERIWFLHQLEPNNYSYNFSTATFIEGPLDVNAFERALNEVIKRHESLRTAVRVLDDVPIQLIMPELQIKLPIIDVSAESELLEVTGQFAQQSFDLSAPPLFRAFLLRFSSSKHVFVTVHHLIADAWSMGILFKEISLLYERHTADEPAQLPDLPIQYADFAAWQREWLGGKRLEAEVCHWRQQLGNKLPLGDLPSDRPRPQQQSFRGKRHIFALHKSLVAAIKHLISSESVTLYMFLLAAFKSLLFRYTGQEDVVVGSAIAGRTQKEIQNLIGLFTNTLVLRTDLRGNPTFLELLKRVRETCVKTYAHQHFSFEKLVEELHPERDLSRNPLFQVMFLLQNIPNPVLTLKGLTTHRLELDSGTSKVDLTISLSESNGELIGSFEYNTDLFDSATVTRMAGHYRTLLEAIVANPDQSIATLPICTEEERHQILIEWNDTAGDYPKDKCIHDLFEEQVERTPEAIAIEFKDLQITYQELDQRANQLAHYLITLGIGPEKLVGICLERSVEMVVGLLGILKAGGAYLPLDPAYPEERLRFMMEDSQVSVLLTQQKLIQDQEWTIDADDARPSSFEPGLQIVCLDRDRATIEQQCSDNPSPNIGSQNLAYVIYTSGSTGIPKGVQIEHRSVVNCLVSIEKQIKLKPQDAWLAVTTICFDIATLELFLPLITGAKVILTNTEESGDATRLIDRIKTSQPSFMQATPSMWQLLFETGWQCPAGFTILSGGEALTRGLADRFLDGADSVWNLYGPTESTIWSTITRVTANQRSVLIGRPIGNTQVYILDPNLQPVPIGVPGELYIGGDGLARGYLNRPELTAEKFVRNSFNDDPHLRLYRTGDLAKYRADGNIEFLGRCDNQVKIRGHRIELGEIESVLMQHAAVKHAIVVPFDEVASNSDNPKSEIENPKSLVAYVVGSNEPTPTVAELRGFLQERVPEFMIPSVFMFLDVLPLMPNGKIDRDALPSPDGARPQLDPAFVEPRTEIEELVAQIWCELLKRDRIGVYDNFFELGGHSLLATRAVARLQNNFQVDLPLRKLFELPTVAGLAEYIDKLRRSSAGTSIMPIVRANRHQALPLSFSQRRLWYLQKVDPNLSAYNIPAAFRIRGDLDSSALEQALNDLIARHEILRSCVKEVDGKPLQEIAPDLRIRLPVTELTDLSNEQAETQANHLFHADVRQLYDLSNAPLLRARLIKLAADDHVFILNFHHIIADGSSLAIFYRELEQFYDGAHQGKKASLPPLSIQYPDFSAWQQEWLQSDAFEIQIAYWKHQLADLPAPVELPKDFDRPVLLSYRGARLTRQLSEQSTDLLKTFSRQHSTTLFMTLFATFTILLSRITGQEDIIVGSTIAGRSRAETEGLIGFFINALPLRLDVSGDPTFSTLLQRVREVCLDAYAHQEMPFEKLVEELRPPRDSGHNPIFDNLFNVADISERTLALPGCDIVKLPLPAPGAKFDIVLHAPEIDGRIELVVVYNASLFRGDPIALLLEQWATLLEQIIRTAEVPISALSLLTQSSRALLPDPTEVLDKKWEGAIHEILSEQARRSPDSIAVIDPEERWTYRELDEASDRLAHSLIAAGVEPKETVAIYTGRNAFLVITIFGVLKAGASFLILDPAYPSARTFDYLRVAQPKGWLQVAGSGQPPEDLLNYLSGSDLRCRIILPAAKHDLLQSLAHFANTSLGITINADDPAYVAFTSGSTGEPKGVICRHGPITHFLPWQQEAFGLTENDRFAMLSGLAYSHLHRDVFTAIHLGATVYIPSLSEARSPDQLANWLDRNAITVLHLTPALGELLLTGVAPRLPSVHRVFFGGDILPMSEVAQIRELAPNAIVGSFYGATETQRAVGYYEITDDDILNHPVAKKTVPLGRGIKDVQLLVLNKCGQLAGIGELGEVFVRSPHLAAGYIGDDELTQRMFITNSFTHDPTDRLYRTGELGRYLPDGNVEWAGRNDRRINIRGFRVELEEIEVMLKQHPTVNNAAVIMQEVEMPSSDRPESETSENRKSKIENSKSESRLVAYVAADEEAQSLEDLLHSYLSARLPDYMLPAHFVILTTLPLNPNGKIDYRALPPVRFSAEDTAAAPHNDIEVKLQAIFAEVLGRPDIGIDDNFFRVGGHSLLAARAAVRIGDAFGVNLALSAFLETPTVSALASKIAYLFSPGQPSAESDKDEREEFEL
jgi:amino acid adenylation domain-containing protein